MRKWGAVRRLPASQINALHEYVPGPRKKLAERRNVVLHQPL